MIGFYCNFHLYDHQILLTVAEFDNQETNGTKRQVPRVAGRKCVHKEYKEKHLIM